MRHTRPSPASLLAIAGATLASLCAAIASADSIVLRTQVRLAPHETIARLRDIAYLEGDAAVRLGATEVADLGASATLELSLDEIRAKILAASATANLIDLSGRSVTIRSASAGKPVAMRGLALPAGAVPAEVPATAVAAVSDRIEFFADEARNLPTPRGLIAEMIGNVHAKNGARVRLAVSGASSDLLDERPGLRRFEVFPLSAITSDLVRMRIVAREGDNVVGRTEISVEPLLEAQVATAVSAVRKGGAIGGAVDLRTEWVKPSEFRALPTPTQLEASAATAKGAIAKGERITNKDITKPVQIRRNDKVVVRRELGSVSIELNAVAEEDGAVGETIRFRAVDRKDRRDQRVFMAEVLGNGRAIIRDGDRAVATNDGGSRS